MDSKLDLFQRMYALNEDYHSKKEQMVWLGTTVYLGFVILSANWLSGNPLWKPFWLCTLGIMVVIFALAFWFILKQAKLKARASTCTSRMQRLIPRFDDSERLSFSEIGPVCSLPLKAGRKTWGPTLLCLPVTFVFFLVQVAVLLLFREP